MRISTRSFTHKFAVALPSLGGLAFFLLCDDGLSTCRAVDPVPISAPATNAVPPSETIGEPIKAPSVGISANPGAVNCLEPVISYIPTPGGGKDLDPAWAITLQLTMLF